MHKIILDNGDMVYFNLKQINFIIVHKTFVEFNFCSGQSYIINRQNCSELILKLREYQE